MEAYSSEWSAGGPIIEREHIELRSHRGEVWSANLEPDAPIVDADEAFGQRGETALIAAMRAFVAERFGSVVELD